MAKPTRIAAVTCAAAALVGVALVAVPRIAAAPATFTVTTGQDAPDAVIDGTCASTLPGSPCTLRAAVQEANATVDPDQIVVDPSVTTMTLDIEGNDEDSAATGDLDVTEDLTIRGNYVDPNTVTVLEASSAPTWTDRAMDVLAGAALTVEALTVRGFDLRTSDDSMFLGDGGAYRNAGTLGFVATNAPGGQSLIELVDQNFGFRGGAIYNAPGAMLTVVHDGPAGALMRFRGGDGTTQGTAGDAGGLLFNDSGSSTTSSTGGRIQFLGGFATDSTGVGSREQGGGVYSSGGTVSFGCATDVNGSRADGDGGGIYVAAGELQLTSGVVGDNQAGGSGGGVFLASGATLRGLDNFACPGGYGGPVAINQNRADTGTGGGMHNGGTVLANRYFEFERNSANTDGGGLYNAAGARLAEALSLADTDMRFRENNSGRDGAGLFNAGTVELDVVLDARFNTAARNGGGMALLSPLTLGPGAYVQVLDNGASGAGGGVYAQDITLDVPAGAVLRNSANGGAGGFHQVGGSLVARQLTVRESGGTAGVELRNARGELTNVTVLENQNEGVIVFADTPTPGTDIDFTTIVGNGGAGIEVVGDADVDLSAVLMAGNGAGNCDTSGATPPALTNSGYSVFDDGSCSPGGTDVVSPDAAALQFQALEPPVGDDHDDAVVVPVGPNPALDRLPEGPCAVPVDQRGVSRPQGPSCDSGSIEAVEANASVSGTVLVAPGGTPAPGASTCVYVLEQSRVEPIGFSRPDPDGNYTVAVPEGTYWVAFVPCDENGEPVLPGPFQPQWYLDKPFDLDTDDVDPVRDGATLVEATVAGATGIDACVAPEGQPRTCEQPAPPTTAVPPTSVPSAPTAPTVPPTGPGSGSPPRTPAKVSIAG